MGEQLKIEITELDVLSDDELFGDIEDSNVDLERTSTRQRLNEHYGPQLFKYKSYSGTINDIVDLCPAAGIRVEQGFDSVVAWVDTYKVDSLEEITEEPSKEKAEELVSETNQQEDASSDKQQKNDIIKAPAETKEDIIKTKPVVAESQENKASVEAVATAEPKKKSRAESTVPTPTDSTIKPAKPPLKSPATTRENATVAEPPSPKSDKVETKVAIEAHTIPEQIDDVTDTQEQETSQAEIVETDEIQIEELPRLEAMADFEIPEEYFMEEATNESDDQELLDNVFEANEDVLTHQDIEYSTNIHEIANDELLEAEEDDLEIEIGTEVTTDSNGINQVFEQLVSENNQDETMPDLLTIDNQEVETTTDEESDDTVRELLEDLTGEDGGEVLFETLENNEEIDEQVTTTLWVVEKLQQATSAEECYEALADLRAALSELLKGLGYSNADELVERILRHYDIATLHKILLQLQSLMGHNTFAKQMSLPSKNHHAIGGHAVRLLIGSTTEKLLQLAS